MARGQTSNEQAIGNWLFAYFRGKGFSAAQATKAEAGALGNFQVESNFNPAAYNPREGARGIAQWEGGRGPNGGLGHYAATHHLPITSLQADLGYLGQELNGPYARVVSAERTAPTASAAAYDWASLFEGNAPGSDPQRQANASRIFDQLRGGHTLTGGGATLASFTTPLNPNGGPIPNPAGPPNPTDILTNPGGTISHDLEVVLKDLAHPLVTFLTNALLVIVGVVGLIIALVMVAHSDDHPNTAAAAPSGPPARPKAAGGGIEGTAEEAAAA